MFEWVKCTLRSSAVSQQLSVQIDSLGASPSTLRRRPQMKCCTALSLDFVIYSASSPTGNHVHNFSHVVSVTRTATREDTRLLSRLHRSRGELNVLRRTASTGELQSLFEPARQHKKQKTKKLQKSSIFTPISPSPGTEAGKSLSEKQPPVPPGISMNPGLVSPLLKEPGRRERDFREISH